MSTEPPPESTNGLVAPATRPLVSIVLPVYDEALVLMSSLTTLYAYLQGLSSQYRFELIVVDDGSTDETAAIAEAFVASRPEVRVLRHSTNFRVGQALRFGFGQSKGDYVVAFDADLSYTPDHIERMLSALRSEHARVVVASPYMKTGRTTGIPWRREVMSRGANRVLAMSTTYQIHTVTGMVRAYDGPFLRSLNLRAMGPDINAEILYKAQILRARVVEIPAHLDWTNQAERMKARRISLRVSNTSKLFMFSAFLFRPIMWFVIPGVLLMLLAVGTLGSLAVTVLKLLDDGSGNLDQRLYQAFATAWDVRPHTFVIGGFSFVVVVQLISLGLLSVQQKRYFEESFHFQTNVLRRVQQVERVVGEPNQWWFDQSIDVLASGLEGAGGAPTADTVDTADTAERSVGRLSLVRLGIVGCGFVADDYALTMPLHPQLTVAGVYDRDAIRATRFADHHGFRAVGDLDKLLGDPDVDTIVNLTNPRSHATITRSALMAGKHVYSEKPLALDIDEAEELVELAESKGLQLAGAPCTVLGETAQTLWRAVRAGKVGPVRLVYAELDDGMVFRMAHDRWASESGAPWPARDEFETGCTLEHAAYYVTWLAAMFGPVRTVTAFSSCQVPDKGLEPPAASAPDLSVACLTFDRGVVARLTCSIVAPHDHHLRVIGDRGVLEIEDGWFMGAPVRLQRTTRIRRRTVNLPARRLRPARKAPKVGTRGSQRIDFARGIADLADAVVEGRSPRLSALFTLHVTEVTLAIHGAAGGGTFEMQTSFDPMPPMPWAG